MKKLQKNMIVDGAVVATFNVGVSKITVEGEKTDIGEYLLAQASSNLQYDVDRDLDVVIKTTESEKDINYFAEEILYLADIIDVEGFSNTDTKRYIKDYCERIKKELKEIKKGRQAK